LGPTTWSASARTRRALERFARAEDRAIEAQRNTLFVSRAGVDADVAAQIGRVLESAGYGVILQQWDFANRHFLERMHEALASGARVVALLSPAYLQSDHCQAEWMNAIADDPLNRNGRLILLRVADCDPPGLLAGLAYWDLLPIRDDPALLAEVVCKAVVEHQRDAPPAGGPYRRDPQRRAPPPSGTITFVFTEIEDGAQRWDRDRAAMQTAVRRHDAIVRDALEGHGGHVFKTTGDAFCAAFSNAADAVAAALALQTALAQQDFADVDGLRVRVAVHTGTADERDGDYFGPTVNRAARLLAIGHGGQVLLSKISVELARNRVELGGLRDLGKQKLKDLSEPEHVFQLDVPGAPAEFPALRSAGLGETNLPEEVKSFIGREADVAAITELFTHGRLVTLVGVGGVGKTSCALKAGAGLLANFSDGVWFVDLAAITDPTLVAAEVGQVFHLVESAKGAVLDALTAHLRGKQTLILLDNCEHLLETCCRIAAALLRACPGVSLLATSREALRINGELVYGLPTLASPERNAELTVADALGFGAVALFVARARAADSRFELTPHNTASVAEICRRLDGIPLALELAAARVRVLAPHQLEQKLGERFRVLTGGARTALPRQQTMRALIDWSYDLLDARDRALLSALSIFIGSFSLESATAVCVSDDMQDFEVLDGLISLVDKSLVVTEAAESETRYRLLESMREYARERLVERGGRLETARRHALAYTELAERLEDDYGNTIYRTWVANAEREIENIRAALSWTFFEPEGDVEVGLRLAATLRRIFYNSYPAEARRWVQTALDRVTAESPQRVVARLEVAEAHLASRLNQFTAALAAARRALTLFEAAGDRRGIANAKRWAGRSLIFLGEAGEGETLLQSALDSYATLGFRQVGNVLLDLGLARSACGDLAGARAFFAQALKRFEEDLDEGNVAITAGTLADAEFHGGDPQAAVRHAQDALAAARHLPRHITVWIQSNLSAFLIALDRFDAARECSREALRTAIHLQSELNVIVLLQHLAAILALEPGAEAETEPPKGRELAARLIGYVDKRIREIEFTREFTEQQEYDRMLAALTFTLGIDPLAELMSDGAELKEERVVDLALSAAAMRSETAGSPLTLTQIA
jgi:predicted ATPase/class 3 adenylate cyclase